MILDIYDEEPCDITWRASKMKSVRHTRAVCAWDAFICSCYRQDSDSDLLFFGSMMVRPLDKLNNQCRAISLIEERKKLSIEYAVVFGKSSSAQKQFVVGQPQNKFCHFTFQCDGIVTFAFCIILWASLMVANVKSLWKWIIITIPKKKSERNMAGGSNTTK